MTTFSRIRTATLVAFCLTAGSALCYSGTNTGVPDPDPAKLPSVAAEPMLFPIAMTEVAKAKPQLPPRPSLSATAPIPRFNWSPARIKITFPSPDVRPSSTLAATF